MSSTYPFDLTKRLTTNPTFQSSRRISRSIYDNTFGDQQQQQLLTVPVRRRQPSYQQYDAPSRIKNDQSYCLVPERNKKFDTIRVRKIINSELKLVPQTIQYDPNLCLELIKDLTVQLKKCIRDVTYSRY
ncbi:unnamed protein product, partial [Didymodactylos carnosus]